MKTTPIETIITRLERKHQLARVEIIAASGCYTVRAIPVPYGAAVQRFRQEAYVAEAERTGSTTIPMARVGELNDAAVERPLAVGRGATIAGAIGHLAKELARVKP